MSDEETLCDDVPVYGRESGENGGCEAAPERWGGPVETPAGALPAPMIVGLELYAYDTELRAAHPSAPVLAPELVAAARGGAVRARHVADTPSCD